MSRSRALCFLFWHHCLAVPIPLIIPLLLQETLQERALRHRQLWGVLLALTCLHLALEQVLNRHAEPCPLAPVPGHQRLADLPGPRLQDRISIALLAHHEGLQGDGAA